MLGKYTHYNYQLFNKIWLQNSQSPDVWNDRISYNTQRYQECSLKIKKGQLQTILLVLAKILTYKREHKILHLQSDSEMFLVLI